MPAGDETRESVLKNLAALGGGMRPVGSLLRADSRLTPRFRADNAGLTKWPRHELNLPPKNLKSVPQGHNLL